MIEQQNIEYKEKKCIFAFQNLKRIKNSNKQMNQIISNKLQSFFPAYPVEKAWLFGSYARGEETDKSDIDILVKFDKKAEISLFDYVRIMNNIEKLLHKKIDLVSEGGIMSFAKEYIDNDKVLIYEREN